MCFLSVCCLSPFPCWESHHLPRMPPNSVPMWACCGGSSGSDLVLLPGVLAPRAGGAPVGRSAAFHVLRGQSPPGDRVGLHCSLYSGWEGSGLLPWPHHPGFHLRLYFHLCMWVVRWGLAPEAALEDSGLPREGQVWRRCSCLGCRGSGSTRDSGELVARLVGNIVL